MARCPTCGQPRRIDGTVASGTPVARRPHRCMRCSELIQPGERYYRWTGRGDEWSGLATWKECAACRAKLGRPILLEQGSQEEGS